MAKTVDPLKQALEKQEDVIKELEYEISLADHAVTLSSGALDRWTKNSKHGRRAIDENLSAIAEDDRVTLGKLMDRAVEMVDFYTNKLDLEKTKLSTLEGFKVEMLETKRSAEKLIKRREVNQYLESMPNHAEHYADVETIKRMAESAKKFKYFIQGMHEIT